MSDPENPLEGIVNLPPEVTELPEAVLLEAPIITPFSAAWPARTWVPAERVTAGMMNGMRDQLNELHAAAEGVWTPFTPTFTSDTTMGADYGCEWMRVGKTLFVHLYMTVTVGASGAVTMNLPGGVTSSSSYQGAAAISTSAVFAFFRVVPSSTTLGIHSNIGGGGWPASATNSFAGQIEIALS